MFSVWASWFWSYSPRLASGISVLVKRLQTVPHNGMGSSPTNAWRSKWIEKVWLYSLVIGRCSTRGESEESSMCRWRSNQVRDLPWFWNLGQMSPEVQNRGTSGFTKRTCVLQNLKKTTLLILVPALLVKKGKGYSSSKQESIPVGCVPPALHHTREFSV